MVAPIAGIPDLSNYWSLPEAHALVPPRAGAKRVYPSTFGRWILKGVRGANGEVVRLRALRIGRRWMIGMQDLADFFAALSRPADGTAPEKSRSEFDRDKAVLTADDRLFAAGA